MGSELQHYNIQRALCTIMHNVCTRNNINNNNINNNNKNNNICLKSNIHKSSIGYKYIHMYNKIMLYT